MRLCPWILQAPTMPAAIGTKNKMRTCALRREKGSDRLPPSSTGPAAARQQSADERRATISKTLADLCN